MRTAGSLGAWRIRRISVGKRFVIGLYWCGACTTARCLARGRRLRVEAATAIGRAAAGRSDAPVAPPELLEAVTPAAMRGEEDKAADDRHVLEEGEVLHLVRRAGRIVPEAMCDQRGQHGKDE